MTPLADRPWSVVVALLSGVFLLIAKADGQVFDVGTLGTAGVGFGSGTRTVIDLGFPATSDGTARSATFVWSAAPCAAAVKIKFFRPSHADFYYYTILGERGPFDVMQGTQTVPLVPVALKVGDLIAISSTSACGGPVAGTGVNSSWDDAGVDVGFSISSRVPLIANAGPLLLLASDAVAPEEGSTLRLLGNRFGITMTARDPRTGDTVIGHALTQGNRFGYFSLPDLTGDSHFPEVAVKMADATASPPPFGGSFWFFYSSLTDIPYTLTVTDQLTGRVRTYSSFAGGPGQLCGGVDTNAFPP